VAHWKPRTGRWATAGRCYATPWRNGRAIRDPSGDLRGALPPVTGEHFAATTEPKRLAELLRAMDGYEGTLTVRCALRLAPPLTTLCLPLRPPGMIFSSLARPAVGSIFCTLAMTATREVNPGYPRQH
jgi:hypothetical protein